MEKLKNFEHLVCLFAWVITSINEEKLKEIFLNRDWTADAVLYKTHYHVSKPCEVDEKTCLKRL